MKRRQLLLALGTTVGISGAAFGTGAFSSSAAGRRLTVSLADDADANLGLDELGDGDRSEIDGGVLTLSFPSLSETSPRTGGDPNLGLGPNSVYEFDRDSDEGVDGVGGLIEITNQSAGSIKVYSEEYADNDLAFELYDVTDPDRTALRESLPELTVGSSIRAGVRIRTIGVKPNEFDEVLRIKAERAEN